MCKNNNKYIIKKIKCTLRNTKLLKNKIEQIRTLKMHKKIKNNWIFGTNEIFCLQKKLKLFYELN